jgi:hypothetical protein
MGTRRRLPSRKIHSLFRGGDRSWYRIPEIPFEAYVRCLKDVYAVLERTNESQTVADVFLKTILAAHSKMTDAQWTQAEEQRLYEKNLSMKMGDFHEELMGKFPGYETLPLGHVTGTDVRKLDDSEFFEVKNRDNTMNSGAAETVVRKLTKLTEAGKGATLVLVNTEKKTIPRYKAPEAVRVLNGRQAYAALSGRESFFDDLVTTLGETFTRFPTYAALLADRADAPLPAPASPEPHSQSAYTASPESR